MDINIEILIQAAKAGGEVLKKYFGQVLETQIKLDASDYRTKADLESETAVLNIIEPAYPEANIHSEERGFTDKKSDFTIIIDPLDGTNNFVLGVPYFSVCIGVLKNKEIIASVVYNPILNQVYHAVRGQGAWLNNEQIHINKESDLKNATVSCINGYNRSAAVASGLYTKLQAAGVKRVANLWSPGLDFCLLASGRIEAIIFNHCEIYDHIPGKLIAKEAGALVTDLEGNQEIDETNALFVASNGTVVHNEVLKIFKGVLNDK